MSSYCRTDNPRQNFCKCKHPSQNYGFYKRLKLKCKLVQDFFLSLFYNCHLSKSYLFDILLEPGLWFVDKFAKYLGPLFVMGVITLKSTVIVIAYVVGLPYYIQYKNPIYTAFVVALGHYLFLNVVFHYWMALSTEPGKVPGGVSRSDDVLLKQVTSICKKCIGPKPPRTHHCSVCNRCVLKMDHHCPWINGCVGHFNHRYFFQYMLFTVLGCLFVMVFGFEIIFDEMFVRGDLQEEDDQRDDNILHFFSPRSVMVYEAIITSGTFVLLGGLTLWHARLISKGETSIEAHINKSETKRLSQIGQNYKNPFDFGPYHNWCLFFGIIEGRSLSSVLLPSKHSPRGDGFQWDSVYSCGVKWNDLPILERFDPAKLA